MVSEIHLIDKNTNIDSLKMRPLNWDIVINGKPYYACFIDEYVHSIGGKWGHNNIWCYPRGERPSFDNLIEYQGKSPVNWGIKYEPKHTTKTKWDETRVSTSSSAIITRNGINFCYCHSIAQAQALLEEIGEHPLNLDFIDFDKKAIGRKIWWRSQPAIITSFNWGEGTISFIPDGKDQFDTPKEFYYDEVPYIEKGQKTLTISIFDKHIWWFRN